MQIMYTQIFITHSHIHTHSVQSTLTSLQIYTYEMKIIKVVAGDAGGYRCEVISKDKCDSSTFEITVEGELKRT